jgi:hypothetical protein
MLSTIKVSVTAAHIAAAKYPSKSPLALALREMGYTDTHTHVTHHFAYIGNKVYALPESAIASERCFDYLAKGGSSQGEIAENIFAYECELVELVQ